MIKKVFAVAGMSMLLAGCGAKTPGCGDERSIKSVIDQVSSKARGIIDPARFEQQIKQDRPDIADMKRKMNKGVYDVMYLYDYENNLTLSNITTSSHDEKLDSYICNGEIKFKLDRSVTDNSLHLIEAVTKMMMIGRINEDKTDISGASIVGFFLPIMTFLQTIQTLPPLANHQQEIVEQITYSLEKSEDQKNKDGFVSKIKLDDNFPDQILVGALLSKRWQHFIHISKVIDDDKKKDEEAKKAKEEASKLPPEQVNDQAGIDQTQQKQ
jgi:hypothetical protein